MFRYLTILVLAIWLSDRAALMFFQGARSMS